MRDVFFLVKEGKSQEFLCKFPCEIRTFSKRKLAFVFISTFLSELWSTLTDCFYYFLYWLTVKVVQFWPKIKSTTIFQVANWHYWSMQHLSYGITLFIIKLIEFPWIIGCSMKIYLWPNIFFSQASINTSFKFWFLTILP